MDGLEVNLVQAGHPYGLDLARIVGIKVTLAALGAFMLILAGHPIVALVGAPFASAAAVRIALD